MNSARWKAHKKINVREEYYNRQDSQEMASNFEWQLFPHILTPAKDASEPRRYFHTTGSSWRLHFTLDTAPRTLWSSSGSI